MYKIILLLVLFYFLFFNKKTVENFNNDFTYYTLYIPKRFKYIKNEMNKIKISPKYIRGPDKNKLKLQALIDDNIIKQKWYSDTVNNTKYIKPYNNGRVACHLGHINILKEFLKTSEKYAIIFEDDIKFKDNEIKNKIKTIINNIPEDTDILYFSYCFEYCDKVQKINNIFSKAYRPLCRHFYLVSKNGAKKIIANTLPMFSSGDRMIGHLIKNKVLNGYIVNPEFLNIQQNRNENIQTELDNIQNHHLCM